jgi:hypothetical protein
MGPRVGADAVAKRKLSAPAGKQTMDDQLVVGYYTD